MDTITHGVAGALLGKALSADPRDRLMRRALVFGSVAPDLDMLGGWLRSDPIFQLEFHRGITHSVIALPVFALMLGLATDRLVAQRVSPDGPAGGAGPRGRSRWKILSLAFGMGLGLHIFMDVITSYGTMLFQPLRETRFSLDMVFIIDLVLGSIVLIPQLMAWAWAQPDGGARRAWILWMGVSAAAFTAWYVVNKVGVALPFAAIAVAIIIFAAAFALPGLTRAARTWPRTRYHRIGVALMIVYLAACAGAHRIALTRLAAAAESSQLKVSEMAALPAPPSLTKWSGLVKSDNGVTRFEIDLLRRAPPPAAHFAHTYPIPNEHALRDLPELQTYLAFARFPWVTAREQDGRKIVEYRDLQFMRPAIDGGEDPPFTFRVQFDKQGNLIAAGLVGP